VIGGDAGLTWDNVNKRLGVGLNNPAFALDINSPMRVVESLIIKQSPGNSNSVNITHNSGRMILNALNNSFEVQVGTASAFRPDSRRTMPLGTSNKEWGTVWTTGIRAVFGNLEMFNEHVGSHLNFGTENTLRARITNTGNVLINTTTDSGAKLHVQAPGALSSDIAFRVRNSANTADLLSLNGLGNLNLASGGFIYGDTTNPFIRLSNAFGAQIGYGTNYFYIGGALFNFHTSAAVVPLRYRSSWGMRLQDSGSATDPASDGLSAMLALGSTTKGFLPPRMTTVQKNAIVAPPSGLLVYDTSLNKLCLFGASSWETITSI
jgi:hypothetical protein